MTKAKKVKIAKTEKVDKANISNTIKKIVEKVAKVIKPNIYTFEYQTMDTDQLKSKRQTTRKRLESYMNKIINSSDLQKDPTTLAKVSKEFKDFYKENYILNDFSVESVRKVIGDKERKDLERMFTILQNGASQKAPKAKKNKETIKEA